MTAEDGRTELAKPAGRLRNWVMVILFLAYMFAFFDRSNVSVLIADGGFTDALGITTDKSAQGLLLTAFLLFYGITCFFIGPVVERFGTRRVLACGLLSWAILMAVLGSTSLLAVFLVCRALLGIGESVLGPSAGKLIKTWFPVHERAKANGAWFIGLMFSQVAAVPLISWWVTLTGWRGSFYILALIGVIPVIIALMVVYDHPTKHPRITKEEVEYITAGAGGESPDAAKPTVSLKFLKNSNFWLIVTMYCASNAGFWGLTGWLPTYLKATLGFSWAQMGGWGAVPALCGVVAVMGLAPLMDRFNRRAAFVLISFLGFMGALYATTATTSAVVAVAAICFAYAFISISTVAIWTMLQNTVQSNQVASATGVLNGTAYVFAAFVPYIIGVLYNATSSLNAGFFFLIALMAVAVVASYPLCLRRL
jgi:sugar phosphate permease